MFLACPRRAHIFTNCSGASGKLRTNVCTEFGNLNVFTITFIKACHEAPRTEKVNLSTATITGFWILSVHDFLGSSSSSSFFSSSSTCASCSSFFGCRVIVLYERIYNQRFWPNVECWIATKMATEDGLVPASEDRLRIQVYGIDSASGFDRASRMYVLGTWHSADAQQAIHFLSQDDILVTNARDKDINLKVVGSLDERIRSHHVLHI